MNTIDKRIHAKGGKKTIKYISIVRFYKIAKQQKEKKMIYEKMRDDLYLH